MTVTGHAGVVRGRVGGVGRYIALPLWQMGQVAAYPMEQVAALPLEQVAALPWGQKVCHQ